MRCEPYPVPYDKRMEMKPDISDIYKKVHGLCLPIDVYLPKQKGWNNRIAVVCIHGGGWTTGISPESDWHGGDMVHQARYFSLLGYIGIAISYRSLNNPDTDILDLIEDCKDAVRFIKANYTFTDTEKLTLLGDSAGAHLATCLGISEDDSVRPAIVVACNPVLDCRSKFSYASALENHRQAASPLVQIPQKCASFLIINGNRDQTTPVENAIQFDANLKTNGFDSEIIVLDGVAHAFILYDYRSSDDEVLQVMQIIHQYLQKKLNPNSEDT